MSEGVEIILSADDQASAKMAALTKNIENNVKNIKDTGSKAKASTEFFGQIANITGNSQIAGFAGQIAGLTEKIGQFSEVSKAGGAGALAFKAGLIGAVGVISFQLGRALKDAIYGVDTFAQSLEHAKERAKDLADETKRIQSRTFATQKEDIDLIADPEAKEAAQKQLFDQIDKNVQGVTARVQQGKKEVDAWAAAWKITDDRNLAYENAQKQLAEDKELLQTLKSQREEVGAMFSERTKANEAQREANRAATEAVALKASEKERIENIIKSHEDRIEIQNTELEKGKEAAAALELEKQGVDAVTAALIAKKEATILATQEQRKAAEETAKKKESERIKAFEDAQELARKMGEATTNTATESRLLTRGPSQDKMVDIALNTAITNKLLEKMNTNLEKPPHRSPGLKLEIVK